MQSMKEWALYYAEKGLPVFPLKAKDKTPATKNGFKDAATDPKKISAWWDRNPNYNIGIATGNGLVVIDLDIKNGKNGYAMLQDWQNKNGELPETWTSCTGSGGYHLLYKTNTVEGNRGGLYEGVDIRGDGGYIVAPPSVHPSGTLYEWEISPEDFGIAEADEKVMKFLHPEPQEQPSERFHSPEVIQEGERNNTLFRLASSLQAKGLDEDSIRAAVTTENEKKCFPPLDDAEVEQIIKSAMKYEPGTSPYTQKKEAAAGPAKIICLADVESVKTKWLWYPYIPLGKITLIQGDPGMGKTMMVLKIASLVSKGGDFPTDDDLFIPVRDKSPGNVIYQTAEDGIADTIVPRLRKMGADMEHVFAIEDEDIPLSMMDKRLEEAMQQYNPKLLILDPLQAYLGEKVDMHRANEVRPVFKHIGNLAEKYNCAVLIVMHMSKMSSNNNALYRGLGSIDIPGAARSVLAVGRNPADPDEKILAQVKINVARYGESLTFRIDDKEGVVFTGTSELQADDILNVARVKKEKQSVKREAAEDFLLEVLGDKGYEFLDTIKEKAAELGVSIPTIYRAKGALDIKSHSIGFSNDKKTWWFLPDVTKEDLPQ